MLDGSGGDPLTSSRERVTDVAERRYIGFGRRYVRGVETQTIDSSIDMVEEEYLFAKDGMSRLRISLRTWGRDQRNHIRSIE